jgi:hypothetical protein
VFDDFSGLSLNESGQTAFFGNLQPGSGGVTSTNDLGVWSEGAGSLAMLAREGNQAAGTPPGAVFNNFFTSTLINDAGQAAFRGDLRQGSGGVTSSNERGVWAVRGGQLQLIVRENTQAPDTPAGANFDSFDLIVLNDNGHLAFQGQLKSGGGGVVLGNQFGIWSEGSGSLHLVALPGRTARRPEPRPAQTSPALEIRCLIARAKRRFVQR